MNISTLHDLLEKNDGHIDFRGTCHDCRSACVVSAMALETGIEIEGGAMYDPWGDDKYVVKCDDCFREDVILRDYQECEVYARVVGYMRPVSQFNEAKQAEFHDRVNFKLGE